eukprot:CFRG1586T1
MGKDLKEVLKGQQKSPQQLGKHEMEIESHASSKEERSNKSDVVDKTGPNEHVANALNDVDQLEEQDIPYEAQLSFMVNRPLEGKILDGYLPSGWDTLESNNGFWVGCLITEAAQFGNLRNFIGSLNDVNEGVGVVVFVPKNTLSKDYVDEISWFRWVSVVLVEEDVDSLNKLAESKVTQLIENFLIICMSTPVSLKPGFTDVLGHMVDHSVVTFAANGQNRKQISAIVGRGKHLADAIVGPNSTFQTTEPIYTGSNGTLFLPEVKNHTCSLTRRLPQLKVKHKERNGRAPLQVCLSIATYNKKMEEKPHIYQASTIPLLTITIQSFLATLSNSERDPTRYIYSIWIGLQVDPFFDQHPGRVEEISKLILEMGVKIGITLKIHFRRYPLNDGTLDITWKYNRLLMDSYEGGCDYMYQYSDDALFVDSWVDRLVGGLEKQGGFGAGGAHDLRNKNTATLGVASRLHLEMLGYFWSPVFKNWFSDNFLQEVYGEKYFIWPNHVRIQNTQVEGSRYISCDQHKYIYRRVLREARMRIYYWLQYNPQHLNKDEKMNYIEQLIGFKPWVCKVGVDCKKPIV